MSESAFLRDPQDLDLKLIQSVFIIHACCICQSTYLLKFLCSPQAMPTIVSQHSQTCALLQKIWVTQRTFHQVGCNGQLSCFRSHILNKCFFFFFHSLFSARFSMCAVCWWFCCIKWPLDILLKGSLVFPSTKTL